MSARLTVAQLKQELAKRDATIIGLTNEVRRLTQTDSEWRTRHELDQKTIKALRGRIWLLTGHEGLKPTNEGMRKQMRELSIEYCETFGVNSVTPQQIAAWCAAGKPKEMQG